MRKRQSECYFFSVTFTLKQNLEKKAYFQVFRLFSVTYMKSSDYIV